MPTHVESLEAAGHEHVQGTHTSTLEVTTDDYLTPAGDCIVGIEATRGPRSFAPAFKDLCATADATIGCILTVGSETVRVTGRGDPRLTLASDRSHVFRTSDYVDDRTVMVGADHAATDLPRSMIESLTNGATIQVALTVTTD